MTSAEIATLFPTPLHREVHRRLLRVVGAGAGELFLDACRAYALDRPFLTSTNLIWHLTREVLSAVRRILEELPAVRAVLDEHDSKSGLAKELREAFSEQGLSDAQAQAVIATMLAHDSLKRSFSAGPTRIYGAAIDGLGVRGTLSETAWRVALKNEKAHKYAHRQGQGRARHFDASKRREWDQFVEALHDVLGDLENHFAGFLEVASRLRTIVSPSNEDLNLATQGIPHVDTVMAFLFEGLTASWLVPLRERHFFDRAPDPVQHENGNSFPRWPAAHYLTRIAPENPDEVVKAIKGVASTENAVVHEEYLRAALVMPRQYAARILEHELHWLESQSRLYGSLVLIAGQLVAHVADREHLELAILATRVLLEPRRGEGVLHHRFSARVHSDYYRKLSRGSVNAIAAVDRGAVSCLLVQLLEAAQGDDTDGIWRASIEDTDQNFVEETLNVLIALLRDQYEESIGARPADLLRQVVEFLECKKHKVFWRLALHLLRVYRTVDPAMVQARLRDPLRLADRDLHHELILLFASAFGELSSPERESVLVAVESTLGPEGQAADARAHGFSLSDGEALAYGQGNLRRWYSMVEAHLDAGRLAAYLEQVKHHGRPEHPEFLSWHGVIVGQRAPMTSAQLGQLSNDELVEILATWTPADKGFGAPSIEGLADSLQEAAAENPERFDGLAGRVAQQRSEYLANLLYGMAKALRDKEMPPVFHGVLVAIEESLPGYVGSSEADAFRVLFAARNFFDALFERLAELDDCVLSRAWHLFRPLLSALHPVREEWAEDRDRLQFAINTIRGQALDTAVDLLASIRKSDPLSEERARLVERIEDAIRRRVEGETCWPVLAVVAHQFNVLMGTDRGFAESLLAPLFDRRPALFMDFVKWCWVSGIGYEVLSHAYESAVARVDRLNDDEAGCLGKHLIFLAAWGRLPVETLKQFVRAASAAGRAEAIGDLGRKLSNAESLSEQERAPIQEIWEMWFDAAAASSDQEDLLEFGWWFVARVLDPDWRLQQLARVLSTTGGRIGWDHEVVNTLGELAIQHPLIVGGCLHMMIERVRTEDGYAYFLGREGLRNALTQLYRTEEGQELARTLINKLIARGVLDFRDLAATYVPQLPEPDAPDRSQG